MSTHLHHIPPTCPSCGWTGSQTAADKHPHPTVTRTHPTTECDEECQET